MTNVINTAISVATVLCCSEKGNNWLIAKDDWRHRDYK